MALPTQTSNSLIQTLSELEQKAQIETNFFQFLDITIACIGQALQADDSSF